MTQMEIVIWSIAVGASIAVLFTYYNRTVLGGFVRALISKEALSAETALTVDELGYTKNQFVKSALLRGGMFRKIVFEIEDEILIASEEHSFSARSKPIDLDTARFYIAEENKIMAEMRYDNHGSNLFGVVVSIILIAILAYLATIFIPFVLSSFSA